MENIDDKKFKTSKYDPTYAASIHSHKRILEKKYVIRRPFLGASSMQPDINGHMRVTLLDWLVKLAEEIRLSPSTYALTIHLIDQALSRITVKRAQFQLLGCSCLLIAAKLEELQPPLVNDLVHRSDYCFDSEELITYEQQLMIVFELQPALPTRYYFAQRYAAAGKCTPRETAMAVFLTELSLYKVEFSLLPMSHVAAAAVHLSLQILRPLTRDDLDSSYSSLGEGCDDQCSSATGKSGTGGGNKARKTKGSSSGSSNSSNNSSSVSSNSSSSSNSSGNSSGKARQIWTENLEFYSQYQEWELVDTILKLREAHFYMEDTALTTGIIGRYSRERYFSVSMTGALRINDVRWDTAGAWTEFWAHPASQGLGAGGVVVSAVGAPGPEPVPGLVGGSVTAGIGITQSSAAVRESRSTIDQSFSTNDLTMHMECQQQQQQWQGDEHMSTSSSTTTVSSSAVPPLPPAAKERRGGRGNTQREATTRGGRTMDIAGGTVKGGIKGTVGIKISAITKPKKEKEGEAKPGIKPTTLPVRVLDKMMRERNQDLLCKSKGKSRGKCGATETKVSERDIARPKAVPAGTSSSGNNDKSSSGGRGGGNTRGDMRPSGTSAFSAPVGGKGAPPAVETGIRSRHGTMTTSRSASTVTTEEGVTTTEEDATATTEELPLSQPYSAPMHARPSNMAHMFSVPSFPSTSAKDTGRGAGKMRSKPEGGAGAGVVTGAAKRARKEAPAVPVRDPKDGGGNTNSSRCSSAVSFAGSDSGRLSAGGLQQRRISDFASIKPH